MKKANPAKRATSFQTLQVILLNQLKQHDATLGQSAAPRLMNLRVKCGYVPLIRAASRNEGSALKGKMNGPRSGLQPEKR